MACATLKRSLELDPLQTPRPSKRPRFYPTSAPNPPAAASPFGSCSTPFSSKHSSLIRKQQLSRTEIQLHCREEMRRLNRRRQLYFGEPTVEHQQQPSTSFGSLTTPPCSLDINALSPKAETNKEKEKPLFTFQQVKLICERMVREREEQLREIYEEALNAKLAEQYDAFVKFTHDHVQRHFETNSAPPSYLS